MKANPAGLPRQRLLLACLSAAAGLGTVPTARGGSIHFDGSLGSAGALNGPNFLIPADRGKQVGGNLFHSFSDFNLIKDDVATFQGPSKVQNILARVTGGSASSIDGTLRSEISGANLYFINFAGVMFGANAKLDLSGSFAVTTADYLKLTDGGKFNARLGGGDTLTAAPVSAFGFLSPAPAPVSFNASLLSTAARSDFTIVGGDLTLDAATVAAPSARLTLVSVAAGGEVPASSTAVLPASVLRRMGSVNLTNRASANINGDGGGKLVIRGGKLQVTGGSSIESFNGGASRGGDVDVRLAESALFKNGRIFSSAQAAGNGGDISIRVPKIAIDGTGISADAALGTGIRSLTEASGNGGNVNVKATGSIELTAGGNIDARSFGSGAGGDIRVRADSLSLLNAPISSGGGNVDVSVTGRLLIDGRLSDPNATRFLAGINVEGSSSGGGAPGKITVHAGDVQLFRDGAISTGTFIDLNSGDINVTVAGILSINRGGIQASAVNGDGGDINIHTRNLRVLNGGVVTASTFGKGDSGNLNIRVDDLVSVSGRSRDGFSSAIRAEVGFGAEGRGGNMTIHARELHLLDGGVVSVDTQARGDAGNLTLDISDLLLIDRQGNPDGFTGIDATVDTGAKGRGGNVTLNAGELRVLNGGVITTSTFGEGDAGRLTMDVRNVLLLDRQGGGRFTGIDAAVNTGGTGKGGEVNIHAGELQVFAGAEFSVTTSDKGSAGNLRLAVDGLALIDSRSSGLFTGIEGVVNSSARGNGGNITMRAGELRLNGGSFTVGTFGLGDAGSLNIQIDGLLSVINGGGIFAAIDGVAKGRGGDVNLQAGELRVLHEGRISTSTFAAGDAGTLTINVRGLAMLDSQGSGEFTGIDAVVGSGAKGRGGEVRLHSGELRVLNAAGITTNTFGEGRAGDLNIGVEGLLLIDGQGKGVPKISSETETVFFVREDGSLQLAVGAGPAGSVRLRAGDLQILRGGSVSVSTFSVSSNGNAGSVDVDVDGTLLIDPNGINAVIREFGGPSPGFVLDPVVTGIRAVADLGSIGHAGNIHVSANRVHIRGDVGQTLAAGIAASSTNSQPAGDVQVRAKDVLVERFGVITSENTSAGRAGSVEVFAERDVTIRDHGVVSASSTFNNAGGVRVKAGHALALHDDATITAAAGRDGGSIFISAGERILVDHSSVVATAGDTPELFNPNGGTGGNITIDPPRSVVLDHATISASAAFGAGGNVLLEAENFLSSNSAITATGVTAGTVEIAAPELDLAAGLVVLPGSLVDASAQLREQCARRLGLEFSSFLVIGRDGVSLGPDEAQPVLESAKKRKAIR